MTGAIVGFMGWVLPWLITIAYLLYPLLGHLWHQLEVGLRVDSFSVLSSGYVVDGVEDIL